MTTIETLRQRIGLQPTDNSRDTEILLAMGVTQGLLEAYLDRFLTQKTYTEKFTHISRSVISLRGYPVDSIISVTGTDVPYHLDAEAGLVHFDGYVHSHEVTIVYIGGFDADAIPGALEYAYLAAFDMVWQSNQSVGGALGSGVVKSVASDGARVEFFDPTSGGASAVGLDPESGLPVSVIGLLNLYRREKA